MYTRILSILDHFVEAYDRLKQLMEQLTATADISIEIIMQIIQLICQQRKANRLQYAMQQALLALQCLSQ